MLRGDRQTYLSKGGGKESIEGPNKGPILQCDLCVPPGLGGLILLGCTMLFVFLRRSIPPGYIRAG